MVTLPVKQRMTAADFENLEESNQIRELIDGELIMPGSPGNEHQDVVPQIWQYLKTLIKSGKIKIAPMDLYLDEFNVPQPDIFWGGNEGSRCHLDSKNQWHGAPDLIVEVLSPGTERTDRRKKYTLYEKHGIQEYWLVHPLLQFIEVYVLVDARYQRQGIFEPGETFISAVLYHQAIEVSKFFEV